MTDDPVAQTVTELYALDRADFVAARDEAAAALRSAGDKTSAAAVKKLGRPTVAAWAVNQVVRANPDLAGRLTDLGVRLRDAQSTLDAGELKALRPERDALLNEAVHATATVAAARGQPLGAAAEEVRATFVAALADPAAATALTSGRLVRAMSYAGFGEVQLDEVVAALPGADAPAPSPTRAGGRATPTQSGSDQHDSDQPESDQPGSDRPDSDQPESDQPESDQHDHVRAQERPHPNEGAPRRKQAARQRTADRERAARLKRATMAVAETEHALRDAERQATAAALAEADAHEKSAAAARRTREIRSLLAAAERDEDAAARHAQAAAAAARRARERVAEATSAWEAATAAPDLHS